MSHVRLLDLGVAGRGPLTHVLGLPSGDPFPALRQWWESPVSQSVRSVAAAATDGVALEVFQTRVTPSYKDVRSLIADQTAGQDAGLKMFR